MTTGKYSRQLAADGAGDADGTAGSRPITADLAVDNAGSGDAFVATANQPAAAVRRGRR